MLSFSFCCAQISATSSNSRSAFCSSSAVKPTAADFSAKRAAALYLFTAFSSLRIAGSRHWNQNIYWTVWEVHPLVTRQSINSFKCCKGFCRLISEIMCCFRNIKWRKHYSVFKQSRRLHAGTLLVTSPFYSCATCELFESTISHYILQLSDLQPHRIVLLSS